jgi:peptidoglycan/xylan/chitin deacetylase (PgdA/CDA1 family)
LPYGAETHRELALRIDVDFPGGLRLAVPFFLDRLAEAGMRATFFVVAGRHRAGGGLKRLLDPSYLTRLRRLGPRAIATQVGPLSLLGGGRFLESGENRVSVRRIMDEGHELAVHGWDHGWWADHVWSAGPDQTAEEIDRAYAAMAEVTGRADHAWGSPSWRTTDDVLRALASRGVPYLAECWGREPFRTRLADGTVTRVPHLPVTLPSLESLMLEEGLDARRAVAALVDAWSPGRFAMACLHDYFEGLLHREAFRTLIGQLTESGIRTVTLIETAIGLEAGSLPVHAVGRAPLPGFHGEVCWQEPAPLPAIV